MKKIDSDRRFSRPNPAEYGETGHPKPTEGHFPYPGVSAHVLALLKRHQFLLDGQESKLELVCGTLKYALLNRSFENHGEHNSGLKK